MRERFLLLHYGCSDESQCLHFTGNSKDYEYALIGRSGKLNDFKAQRGWSRERSASFINECLMMKKITVSIYFVLIFVISLIFLLGFLLASSMVPEDRIQRHMEESADIMCEHSRIWYMIPGVESSQNHLYADAITLNIAYHFSDGSPLESVMWAKYYTGDGDVNTSLRTSIYSHLNAETEYLRYWHGSSAVVRFLHLFLNITQIYWMHAVMIAGLFAVLVIVLLRKRLYAELAAFVLSMVMISIWFVPFCLEYTWIFLCMLISSVLGIKFAEEGKKTQLYYLFLITGMVTVYLDFLSAETLTLVVPLILILRVWRKRADNRYGCREQWGFFLKSAGLWAIGYVGMWISKWIIASAVLHENVMPYVKEHISDRIEGVNPAGSLVGYIVGAIMRNVKCLFPFDYGKTGAIILLAMIVVFIVLPVAADKVTIKNEIDKRIIALYLSIGGIPILRYAVLHSHSWYHASFTYRALAGTVLALCCITAEIIEWKRADANS